MKVWNPWHGCKKISAGCRNCYVYRIDEKAGKDSMKVEKTGAFNLPIEKNKGGLYRLTSFENPIYTCLSSDFFIEEADEWRKEIWEIMKIRSDLQFKIITKRIERIGECVPPDWESGYENVTIVCTCENQETADYRIPILLEFPIKHREIIHEPMLESINIDKYLKSGRIERVTCGGESGENARLCDYSWILNTRHQCLYNNVSFVFKQTGENFCKDGKLYHIPRKYQMAQAEKANINFRSLQPSVQNGTKPRIKRYEESEYYDFNNPFNSILLQLSKSPIHNEISLCYADRKYYREHDEETIRKEAEEIVRKNIAHAMIQNDGKQTPRSGHPVYSAQHATACCCRKCLYDWHYIPMKRKLSEREIKYVVDLIMEWLRRDAKY